MPSDSKGWKFPKWGDLLLSFFVLSILAIFLVRLLLGVELTDEAYYTALAARFTLGDHPFLNNWDVHQTSAILYSPLVSAFRAINGDFSGVILFMRLAAFAFKLAFAGAVFFLLKRTLGRKALLVALPLAIFAPYSLCVLSYNTLNYSLVTLGCFLVFSAAAGGGSGKRIRLVAAGSLHGLAVFAYPATLALTVFNTVAVHFLFRPEKNASVRPGLKPALLYSLSCAAALAAMILMVVFNTGWDALLEGLNGLSAFSHEFYHAISPHFRLIKTGQLILLPLDSFFLTKFVAITAFNAILYQNFRNGKTAFVLFLVTGYLLMVLYVGSLILSKAAGGGDIAVLSEFTVFSALMAPVFRFYTGRYRKLFDLLLITVGAPAVLLWLGSFWVSMARLSTAGYLLISPALLSPLFIAILAGEHWPASRMALGFHGFRFPPLSPSLVSAAAGAIWLAVVPGLFLFAFYGSVFRDGPVWTLTQKVKSGIYRGLYTQPERAAKIERLEGSLRRFEEPSKSLMVLDHAPYAYLMTGMKPCTPFCWDVTLSHYGKQTSDLAFLYFNRTGSLPDRLFLIGEEGKKVLDTPGFELGVFIRANYIEIYRDSTEPFTLRVMDRK